MEMPPPLYDNVSHLHAKSELQRTQEETKIQSRISVLALLYLAVLSVLFGCAKPSPPNAEATITIVAAENFYGSLASEIAGNSATTTSILTNPNQDPHEYTPDAQTAKAVNDANIVIYNGMGYDTWMQKLLATQAKPGRIVLCVADLIGAKSGDNPHLCYDPRVMPALAGRLATLLKQPGNLARFQARMDSVTSTIAEIRSRHSGTPITATEPVFDYMASAIGLVMKNQPFQLAVMNGTEPGAQTTASFETSLRSRAVKLLLYNSQVTSPLSERMRSIAEENGVPIVGITELQPPNARHYTDWMLAELHSIEQALDRRP